MTTGQTPPPALPPPPLPGWLGSAVQVTTQVGVPTVFAGVLLWFVLTRVGGTLDMMQKAEEDRVRILAAMQDTLVAALDRQTQAFEKAMRDNIEANRAIAERIERRPPPRAGGGDER